MLLVAGVVYVASSCLIQADLCRRVGEMEHVLDHFRGGVHHTD